MPAMSYEVGKSAFSILKDFKIRNSRLLPGTIQTYCIQVEYRIKCYLASAEAKLVYFLYLLVSLHFK